MIGGKAISFEDRLEKIETKAAPAIRRLVERRSLSGITPQDRKRLADFAAAQSFRTKAFYEGFAGKPDRAAFGALLQKLWASTFITADEIARRHWALMVIETDEVFYLGDHPLVLQRTENPSAGGSLRFDVAGVEAYLPLSPKCALYMPCRATGDEIITGYRNAVSMHRNLRSAVLRGRPGGSSVLELTQRVMRQSRSLFDAFTEGTPIVAASENIENLNYLRCLWAYAALHSNRRDFAFARRVFREHPEYRNVLATSVLEQEGSQR